MDCQATSFLSFTQCDPTSGIDPICRPATVTDSVSCAAKRLAPPERQDLVIQVLAGTETVSELARQHEVSRKFLYPQVHTAEEAEAFTPSSRPDNVLFYLPVTKTWLRQLVLALVSGPARILGKYDKIGRVAPGAVCWYTWLSVITTRCLPESLR